MLKDVADPFGRIACAYCGTTAVPAECNHSSITNTFYHALVADCASCGRANVWLKLHKWKNLSGGLSGHYEMDWCRRVDPQAGRTPRPFPHTKKHDGTLLSDYEEACAVLSISSQSAATLARRCLQSVLWDQGYSKKDLSKQLDDLFGETDPKKVLPIYISESVDAIRNYGNFGAHKITDKTTLQIVSVEPIEAEWCIDLIEQLFEHYYEKPEAAKARKAQLNKKLKSAGKPPAK